MARRCCCRLFCWRAATAVWWRGARRQLVAQYRATSLPPHWAETKHRTRKTRKTLHEFRILNGARPRTRNISMGSLLAHSLCLHLPDSNILSRVKKLLISQIYKKIRMSKSGNIFKVEINDSENNLERKYVTMYLFISFLL